MTTYTLETREWEVKPLKTPAAVLEYMRCELRRCVKTLEELENMRQITGEKHGSYMAGIPVALNFTQNAEYCVAMGLHRETGRGNAHD